MWSRSASRSSRVSSSPTCSSEVGAVGGSASRWADRKRAEREVRFLRRNHVSAWIRPAGKSAHEVVVRIDAGGHRPGAAERSRFRRSPLTPLQSAGRSQRRFSAANRPARTPAAPAARKNAGSSSIPRPIVCTWMPRGSELLDRRSSVDLDEMVALLQLPRRSASHTAVRCSSSSSAGHRDVHVDLADVGQDRERVM